MILISFGTRPEFIKIKPLIKAFTGKIPFKLLFTGQHVDLLSDVEGDIHKLTIEDGSNRLDSIVSSMMNNDAVFEGVDAVLVQGDTTSVFAVALAAFHRRIKIIHLEAGLRTFNKDHPYPEEFNRRAVSVMADIHLSPTELCTENLNKERVDGKIFTVGNTVLDNLVDIQPEYTNKVVITMHRRENHHIIPEWFAAFDRLALENPQYEFIIPLHPNPNVQKHKDLLKHVKVVEPMQYAEFIKLLSQARLVITDSGGLQEESSFFAKKCIVCREATERVEGMGTFAFMSSPDRVENDFYSMIDDYIPEDTCPYGDGHSAERITNILLEEL
jgi:UDP-N-acetylglucosamine 2-epimerase (non-hydrolysing)|tara:strand:- start:285 stop:1271 length:987 start_codon:yes stop_codon:yes gene_type:complete